MPTGKLQNTVVRDFGGGLNVADNEYNVKTSFQVISDNLVVGVDGSLAARFGYELWADFRQGTVTEVTGSVEFTTVNTETGLQTNLTITNGDHITFTAIDGATDINGIPVSEVLNVPHGCHGNEFHVRSEATSSGATTRTCTYTIDDHVLAGTVLDAYFYEDSTYVFAANGEVARISGSTITRVWDYTTAVGIHGAAIIPWRECEHIDCDVYKQRLLIVNGIDKDKPIQISSSATNIVEFYFDPATASNAKIPRADFIHTISGYTVLGGIDEVDGSGNIIGDSYLAIGSRYDLGLFARNIPPADPLNDGIDIDLDGITSSPNPKITGLGQIRDKLFVSFYDQSMLGQLGVYDSSTHTPNFDDSIAEHGAVSHRSIVSLGNDILMCDYAGVPSINLSSVSGSFVPYRVSHLIDPMIQKNLKRLTDATRRKKIFSVYNIHDRQYMLFMPKYEDNDVRSTARDPFLLVSHLGSLSKIIVYLDDHGFEEDDYVTISGATATGTVDASAINGSRQVLAVLDRNTFVIAVDESYLESQGGIQGGGSSVTIQPTNDEMICYVYTYNPTLKIRRWTRFRNLKFTYGTRTIQGDILMGMDGKLYRMGTSQNKLYADSINDYDYSAWATSTAYSVGDRVADSTVSIVYKCIAAHTSNSAGTFENDRNQNEGRWEEYIGDGITFVGETPWSDFGERERIKNIRSILPDIVGSGRVAIDLFTNNHYLDLSTMTRTPTLSLDFVGIASGGYGLDQAAFGTGRRVREQFKHSFTARFKLAKLRFSGTVTEPTQITAISMEYLLGSNRL